MRFIDAVWEEKNLGFAAQEVVFEQNDKKAVFDEVYDRLCAPYQVAKVKADNYEILSLLQSKGFTYVEDQIDVFHDLHEVSRNPLHQRLQDAVSYHKMSTEDINEMMVEIKKGMFDTDRIALDPYFGKEVAAKRYSNWISDLIAEGNLPYVLTYKENSCAFVVLKALGNGTYRSVLGGYYEKYRTSGLGVVEKEMDIVKELGGKGVETSVSSNNPLQLRALCINGYIPTGISHVLVKHT